MEKVVKHSNTNLNKINTLLISIGFASWFLIFIIDYSYVPVAFFAFVCGIITLILSSISKNIVKILLSIFLIISGHIIMTFLLLLEALLHSF